MRTAVIILLAFLPVLGRAQERVFCIVCGKGPLVGKIWKHRHGVICPECKQRELRCDHCGLPIIDNYLKTRDGRYICKFEKDDVVVDEKQAKLLFDQAVKSLLYISGNVMRLRGPAPDVRLFDIDYWNNDSSMRRGGFSQTRQAGTRYTHNVVLLSGLPKDELVSVCAHEYTHLWINENRKSERKIENNTIEAICELAAYKVATRAGFTNQLERIEKNPYTQGRIDDLLAADRKFGFFKVLEWVRTGRNATVSIDASPPAASARSAPAPSRPSATTSASSAAGLSLAAIIRTSRGYRAQINGVFFYTGDLKRITYNGRPANLQCLRISEDGVMVSINRGKPQLLKMSP
jgi:hypothetical protein